MQTDSVTQPPTGPPANNGRRTWFEIAVVLAVFAAPSLVHSLLDYVRGPANVPPPRPLIETELLLIALSIGPLLLVFYLITRSDEPVAAFGITRPRWVDPGWGVVTWAAGYLLRLQIDGLLITTPEGAAAEADLTVYFKAPIGWWEWGLVGVAGVMNGLTEEMVMRAYLLTRLERMFGSTFWAWAMTSVLFGAYHIHYGPVGAIGIACVGMVYGLVFCATRRLWPVALAHAIADIVPFIML